MAKLGTNICTGCEKSITVSETHYCFLCDKVSCVDCISTHIDACEAHRGLD